MASALAGDGRGVDVDAVLVVVSELVTNAVLHGGTEVEVLVDLRDDGVRLEVRDGDPSHPPVPREPSPRAVGGRGLGIVDALADEWGWQRTGEDGKVVWCELRRSTG